VAQGDKHRVAQQVRAVSTVPKSSCRGIVSGISDLDVLVLECRNGVARSYIAEAVACVKIGTFRAAIVVTWVAVVHDLIAKLDELAAMGDSNAELKIKSFRNAVAHSNFGVMLEFERSILDVARDQFELLAPIAHDDLSRLQTDRNRCAHPSMIDGEMDYHPAPELARCHVVNAVAHLLRHGPVQGKAAMDRLQSDLTRTYFPDTLDALVEHLRHGPLGNPRASLVRTFLDLLLKKCLLSEPSASRDIIAKLQADMQRSEQASRCHKSIQAIVAMHRSLALPLFHTKLDALVTRTNDEQLVDAIQVIALVDGSWEALSLAQRNRIVAYVRRMPDRDLEPAMSAAWKIVALRSACQDRLDSMSADGWSNLARVDKPPAEWIGVALRKMMGAGSFNAANEPAKLVVRAASLSRMDLEGLLSTAKDNGQLAWSMGLRDVLRHAVQTGALEAGRGRDAVHALGIVEMYEQEPWFLAGPKPT
jgi:hypothetical protein